MPDDLPKIRLDVEARRAWLDGKILTLTRLEFDLLVLLAANPGRVVEYHEIRNLVWGGVWGTGKSLNMHVSCLRRKLGDQWSKPRYIATVRGVGLRLESGTVEPLEAAEPEPEPHRTRVVLVKPGDALVFGNVGDVPERVVATAGALRDQLQLAAVLLFQGDIDMAAVPTAVAGGSRD